MIFDRIVSATFENLGYLRPLIVDDAMHEEENPLLLFIPIDFFDSGVQVIVPTFTTLLSHPAVEMLGDKSPLLRAVCHD